MALAVVMAVPWGVVLTSADDASEAAPTARKTALRPSQPGIDRLGRFGKWTQAEESPAISRFCGDEEKDDSDVGLFTLAPPLAQPGWVVAFAADRPILELLPDRAFPRAGLCRLRC